MFTPVFKFYDRERSQANRLKVVYRKIKSWYIWLRAAMEQMSVKCHHSQMETWVEQIEKEVCLLDLGWCFKLEKWQTTKER
jgi:hypothetical protein